MWPTCSWNFAVQFEFPFCDQRNAAVVSRFLGISKPGPLHFPTQPAEQLAALSIHKEKGTEKEEKERENDGGAIFAVWLPVQD